MTTGCDCFGGGDDVEEGVIKVERQADRQTDRASGTDDDGNCQRQAYSLLLCFIMCSAVSADCAWQLCPTSVLIMMYSVFLYCAGVTHRAHIHLCVYYSRMGLVVWCAFVRLCGQPAQPVRCMCQRI